LKINVNSFRNEDVFDMAQLIFKPQISYANEINDLLINTFLTTNLQQIPDHLKSIVSSDNFQKCILAFERILQSYEEITLLNANEIVEKIKQETQLKGKDLYLPIRFVAIGKEHGPEMNKILTIVGKENIMQNLKKLI
jgi:glutamyl/glutaminyl-tRNA synthetase